MTQTALPTPDLAAVEGLLQQHLQTQLPEIAPVQVSCFVKRDTMLIVVQHANPPLAHPRRAFRLLEDLFAAEQLDQRYRGLMYLKVDGRQQPYAFNTQTEPKPPERDVAAQVRAASPEGFDGDRETETAAAAPWFEDEEESLLATEPTLLDDAPEVADDRDESETDFDFDGELLDDEEEEPAADAASWGEALGDRFWPALIAAGVAVSIIVFFGSLYLVSRPCVFRRCEQLEVAQELANEAVATLQDPPSGRAVLQAQQQLAQAIELLETIPGWSGAHEEAANLLVAYNASAEKVAELVEALQLAAQAANLTQNPPLPVERWQESQRSWRGAIAILNDIPAGSEFYDFAREKIREYRENLSLVNRRLEQERAAVENFAAAQEAAKVADVRLGVAQSLDNLRLAEATWQTAIDRLAAIPASTTPYVEAQPLLADYRPKLVQASDRLSRESFAQDAYDQGESLGQLAAAAQAMNQWEQAVTHWRNALNYVKQVPSDAFVYAKAQPLVERYSAALNTAQSRLEEKVQVRQARSALTRICQADGTICVYTVTEALISVRLTPNYVQRVRRTAAQARDSNDVEVQADLLDHIFNLEKALIEVSEDTGIPLEIYTTDNVLVKRHKP